MTLAQLKLAVRALGLTVTKTAHAEYRVNYANGAEETAYYTDSAEDALATAQLMAKHKAKRL
jgi:hypothetical protein